MRLVTLVRQRSDLTLVPPAALKLGLDQVQNPAHKTPGPIVGGRKAAPPSGSRKSGSRLQQAAAPSWWTARAREAEIKPGFAKAEILKPAHEDPRASGGVFERVGALLSELLDRR